MADYPDFTYRGDVDIIAQTIARVSVDIIAQTLSALDINITAQDLAELVIKINAQTVGVYLQPEWAALQDEDVDLEDADNVGDAAWVEILDYTVPANRELYVSQWGFMFHGNNGMQARAKRGIYADPPGVWGFTYKMYLGGMVGASQALTKPIKVLAGERFVIECIRVDGIAVSTNVYADGYLRTV